MDIIIYRGNKEIGGTLIELRSHNSRILIDAGYPLFLNNKPIPDHVASKQHEELLELGVLPDIKGLYFWDENDFDGVIISHAHLDHYGLLKYINPQIPIYLSKGTKSLIGISQIFQVYDKIKLNIHIFEMYKPFTIGNFRVMPYLMDHSAFDAAAFEISNQGKAIIYTGDFRGHGRKSSCLSRFIMNAKKEADALLIEGTMFGRQDDKVITEEDLEKELVNIIKSFKGPVLFQASGQNIDRLVSFYRAAIRANKIFVVDVYTANVLYELRKVGTNKLPYPSNTYPNIRVFYPYRLTKKIFDRIDGKYAKKFSNYYISKDELKDKEDQLLMLVRPSMEEDLRLTGLSNGLFIYSLWSGYRSSDYQVEFEAFLKRASFKTEAFHTSGHATIKDIRRVINGLKPKCLIPIHTMKPEEFIKISDKVILQNDGDVFKL